MTSLKSSPEKYNYELAPSQMSNLQIEFMSIKLNAEVVCELLDDYKVETLNRIQLVLQYKDKEIKMD